MTAPQSEAILLARGLEVEGVPWTRHEVAAELRRLHAIEAETEGLRKDAERYRWLRNGADGADWEYLGWQLPEEADKMIDAAIAQQAQQEPK